MKVLNLYAGIGGNRKLWDGVDVTAVEYDEEIGGIYQYYFPNDTVIIADAHQYLLDHYREFDFIWSSPPCPTHSQIRVAGAKRGQYPPMYPDFKLWQEITFLKHYTKDTAWVVENVSIYYDPIIKPTFSLERHLFWASFAAPQKSFKKKDIPLINTNGSSKVYGFDIGKFKTKKRKDQILRNMVNPEVGLHVFEAATGCVRAVKQWCLF
jgi:DNA (cytosine-5)-methyltransferase 1